MVDQVSAHYSVDRRYWKIASAELTRFLALCGHRFGRDNSSGIEQRSEACGCIAPHLWRHMAVELKRGLHAVVPKSLAHSLDVDALLKQQRGVRMTEAM